LWIADPRASTNPDAMSERSEEAPEPTLLHILGQDEELHIQARSVDSTVAITDRRLIVTSGDRVELDIPYEQLRRVQFDIERGRPATLVLVPEWPSDRPQVLAIPPEEYEHAAMGIGRIGQYLARTGSSATQPPRKQSASG
jgi:hypothetical protein